MGIWKLKRRCPSAVVYNSDTDGYQPRFGCNVWRCRCPDKRNLSREISQRNLSCHDNSLHRLLPPSPLLSSSLLTLLLRLRLRLPIRILFLRLPIPTLLRVSIPTLVVVTQNKSAGQKGGRFVSPGGGSASTIAMSALPLKADMCGALAHVCFGPIADIRFTCFCLLSDCGGVQFRAIAKQKSN